jgi:hypothetical protein
LSDLQVAVNIHQKAMDALVRDVQEMGADGEVRLARRISKSANPGNLSQGMHGQGIAVRVYSQLEPGANVQRLIGQK